MILSARFCLSFNVCFKGRRVSIFGNHCLPRFRAVHTSLFLFTSSGFIAAVSLLGEQASKPSAGVQWPGNDAAQNPEKEVTRYFPWDPCKNDTEKTGAFADCIVSPAENESAKPWNSLGDDKPRWRLMLTELWELVPVAHYLPAWDKGVCHELMCQRLAISVALLNCRYAVSWAVLKLRVPHAAVDNWWKSCCIAQEAGEGKTMPFKKTCPVVTSASSTNKIDATNKRCSSVRTGCTCCLVS